MLDGNLLLKAVLRTHAREESVTSALVDFLQEHHPAILDKLHLEAKLLVRSGSINVEWVPLSKGKKLLRLEAHHNRGTRGHRVKICYSSPTEPDFGAALTRILSVYRS